MPQGGANLCPSAMGEQAQQVAAQTLPQPVYRATVCRPPLDRQQPRVNALPDAVLDGAHTDAHVRRQRRLSRPAGAAIRAPHDDCRVHRHGARLVRFPQFADSGQQHVAITEPGHAGRRCRWRRPFAGGQGRGRVVCESGREGSAESPHQATLRPCLTAAGRSATFGAAIGCPPWCQRSGPLLAQAAGFFSPSCRHLPRHAVR